MNSRFSKASLKRLEKVLQEQNAGQPSQLERALQIVLTEATTQQLRIAAGSQLAHVEIEEEEKMRETFWKRAKELEKQMRAQEE